MAEKLFSRVKAEQVIRVSLTVGMGQNELVWGSRIYGKDSTNLLSVVTLALQLETPGYTDKIRSQPYTWDFENDQPRPSTPLKFMLSIFEHTSDNKYRISNLSVYDLSQWINLTEDEAVLSQGDPALPWHYNYWRAERAHVDGIMAQLVALYYK